MGTNWSVTAAGAFTFFGQEGFVNGRSWVVPSSSGVEIEIIEIDFEPRVDALIAVFIELSAPNEEIAYVGVSPVTALKLALEGSLTKEILEGAEETPETITVTLPLHGTDRKVVILKGLEYPFAILDKDGEMI